MNNNIGMFGKGRVINGRIVFTEVLNGRGFNHEVSRPEVKPVITREPSVQHGVSMIKETIDVPSFMKKELRPAPPIEPVSNVIHVNFAKDDSEEEDDRDKGEKIAEALEDIINHAGNVIGKAIKRNPVFKYFFGEEE